MDRYRNINTFENYTSLLKSGMFWEFHPELTGDWDKDKVVISGESLPFTTEKSSTISDVNKSVYSKCGCGGNRVPTDDGLVCEICGSSTHHQ